MQAMYRRTRRTAGRGAVLSALAAVLWTTATPPAAAHTDLAGSDPAAGASVRTLPDRVRLTFTDEMTRKYAKVAVTGPGGRSAVEGTPEVTGKEVAVDLADATDPGRYTVGYRVVSADGHPVSGSVSFTLKPSPGPASPSTAAGRDEGPAPGSSPSPAGREAESSERHDPTAQGPATETVLQGAAAAVLVFGAGWAWLHLVRRKRARHEQ